MFSLLDWPGEESSDILAMIGYAMMMHGSYFQRLTLSNRS